MTQHSARASNPRLSEEALQTILAAEAITDEDWELIGNIVETLRKRYPGLHIEYGPW